MNAPRLRLVPIGEPDPEWGDLTEAYLWPGKPRPEEREATEFDRLATTEDLLKAALVYAGLGWPVLPLWWIEGDRCACGRTDGCKPGKHPLGRLVSRGLYNATTDTSTIRSWWRREPRTNVGAVTGPVSGIVVVDVDGAEGEVALAKLERKHEPFPDIYPMQWTGGDRGGWQAFFAWPEGHNVRNSAGRLGRNLDSRGDGGYIVLPPSRTTEAYRWAPDRDPWRRR